MTLIRCIENVLAEGSERPAVACPAGAMNYGELWARSGALAERLRAGGVGRGDLVALCLPRSTELVVGALAIMRAGAAYVAIDSAYPDERVRWMIEDSGAAALVADAEIAGRAGDPRRPTLLVDESLADAAATATTVAITGEDLAYVVYTSGSTGRPKGVTVGHDSLLNLIDWHRGAFGVTAADRCTQIASPGFDAAMWEIWPTLATGATLVIVPESLRADPVGLREWLVAQEITVTFLPTVLAESVIRASWPADCALRHLLTGGDALTARPAAGTPFTVTNNYGLSETTVVATSGEVTPAGDGAPSIGRAIAGVQLQVADEDLVPVTPGAAGELLIGGIAVARGYLGRPELTAERFLERDGGRWYRTGDRVRITADGEIEFLGRIDDQLSIRGFRVEPGEVVAALTADPAVAAAAVVATGAPSAERALVAYVVAEEGTRPTGRELSDRLAAALPSQMIPARYVWLEALPLTAHGKLDREELARLGEPGTALPAPEFGEPSDDTGDTGDTATAVAAIIGELLGAPAVGLEENFFLLGGHSMLGAQLIVRLEDRFGVELGLRFLFDHPTAAAIAEQVDAERDAEADMLVSR